ncbi:uncharacterized protein LOC131048312 isoform X2 [Cryptomeria japonica]|uniref:uncharacterized protein LOC131048312 isoform X2 n=1 Tax=Cryptomeria japonica TaxID=3369 RepID=UPI0025AC362F|nr:uncharacterized protein LOC131048312 isoform X2 [Cryptomeria japonica]
MGTVGFIFITFGLLWIASFLKLWMSPKSLSKSKSPFLLNDDKGLKKKLNLLLLTAHPDDESMFFIPTILYLTSVCHHNIYILCISTGNAEGKGHIRKDEMLQACLVLKVPVSNVSILDLPQLQDGFGKRWDHNLLAEIIGQELKNHDIKTIITFDDYGISGHPQHRAVHIGVCIFLKENMKLSQGPEMKTVDAWQLISTNIMRKYSGPFDIWFSILFLFWLEKEQSYCVFNKYPHICFSAMGQHKSQWIWYRKLFVIFSSYTYVNTLRKIRV